MKTNNQGKGIDGMRRGDTADIMDIYMAHPKCNSCGHCKVMYAGRGLCHVNERIKDINRDYCSHHTFITTA